MTTTLISVLMPVRNGMPYLAAAVDSFLAQDWPEKQLIIVDGRSLDGSADYLAALEAPNIKVVSGSDSGATEALNRAASLASGDILGLLMSDDWLEPGALSAVAQAFSEDRSVGIVAGTVTVREDGYDTCVANVPAGEEPLCLSRILGTPYGAGYFVKADLWRSLHGFDQTYRYGADRDFLMRARLSGASALGVKTPVYCYRKHNRSDTLGGSEGPIIEFLNDHLVMAHRWLDLVEQASVRRSILAWRRKEAIALTRLYLKHRTYHLLWSMLIAQSSRDPTIALRCMIVVLRRWVGLARRGVRLRFQES